jgi:hypothetical protein
VEKAIGREKVLIKNIQQRTPLVETYIQNTKPDVKLYQVPVSDQYMLSRVDFGKGIFDKSYKPRSNAAKQGFFKGSMGSDPGVDQGAGDGEAVTYIPLGFTQMMFLDPKGFDNQHYVFSYVRREFLGSVRTWVYDVHPKVNGMGRFFGRIWVEDQDGNIVRFNGTFTIPAPRTTRACIFHFDSWRMNVQPGIWLPVAIYVEETERIEGDKKIGLKAQTHFWGYSLKLPTRESENVSVKIDDAVDKSDDSQDVGPLQATRAWVTQAENNVIDRLVEAGWLRRWRPAAMRTGTRPDRHQPASAQQSGFYRPGAHPHSAVDHGRGHNGRQHDSDQQGADRYIAAQRRSDRLGDGHGTGPHRDGAPHRYPLRLQRPSALSRRRSTFQQIDMYHSDHDNAKLPKRPWSTAGSMYKDRLPSAGLYYAQLVDREKNLKALNTPKLGDSLLKADGTPWMADLLAHGSQDQLGRPHAAAGPAAGQLAQDRSLGRQGASVQRQDLCLHEPPRQDAAGGDSHLFQVTAV